MFHNHIAIAAPLSKSFVCANDDKPGAKAIVSNTKIIAGDIVTLRIKATGDKVVFPNIEKIDGIKVLSHHERITNIHTYNLGKFRKERTTLILTFAPQKDMTIPSYEMEIDGRLYKTKPIKLKVENNALNENNHPIFLLNLKSNQKSAVVGEAFLVTVSFVLQQGVTVSRKFQYSRPEFKGFFVKKVDEGKSYREGNNQVTELKYILTPHSEGNFTLGPAQAKIGLQDKSKKAISNKDFAVKWYEKASNTLDVEVFRPKEESDLVGKFSLDSSVDTQEVKANKPVNLTLKIEGRGNLNHFDFPDYEIDGVMVYDNDAKIDVKVVDGQIYSSYSKKFAFISEKSFIIPERIFSMYDPTDEQLKVLKINALNISVNESNTATVAAKFSNSMANKKVVESAADENEKEIAVNWWILVLSFILGSLLYYILRYLPKLKRKSSKESEALKILYGHISKDPEVEEMVRKLYARKNGDKSVEINKKRLKELIEYFR
jgi:hypothetical protein